MRHRSLIGPLVLILIGVLFLMQNLYPGWISFELIATYWPFLLIIWGALRLIEILYWRLTSKPLPARGISGGEWTLIVFICLIGAGLFLIHRHAPHFPQIMVHGRGVEIFGETYDYPIPEQRLPAKVARIVIDNPRGNTRVVGADTQEVKLGGRMSIRAFSQTEADEAHRKSAVTAVPEGDHLLVRTARPAGPDDSRVSTDLELTVPRGTSIQANGGVGDFDILNLDGGVEITSGNAGVRLQDVAGKARVDLRRSDIVRAVNVKGDVEVLGRGRDVELENIAGSATINGYYSGDILCRNVAKPVTFQSGVTDLRMERVPGEFHVSLGDLSADNVVGPIQFTAQTKDVEIKDFQGDLRVAVQRGDVKLLPGRAPAAPIDATTRSGDVELTLPADAQIELAATTSRGEVDNGFGAPLQAGSDGPGGYIRGTIGRGPKVTLTTGRGEIVVRKQ